MSKSYSALDDRELVLLSNEGDALATEQLLQNYKEAVRSKAHLYFMLGADGEDIVQEGMIGVYKAIRSFDPGKGASFRTFADICINRQIITAIKTANRQKHWPLNNSLSLDKPVDDEESAVTLGESLAAGIDTDPEAMLLMGEMAELLLSQDAGFFSELERTVLNGLLSGYTYKDIAAEQGKSPKSIDNAIQRIRKKLNVFFGG